MDRGGDDDGRQSVISDRSDMKVKLLALVIRFGLWLARKSGWTPIPTMPPPAMVEVAKSIVANVEARFPHESGLYKQREALRVLMNVHPQARTRDLALLIELALQ